MSASERECPACEGSGAVYVDDGDGGTDSELCDICAGDGRVIPASDHQEATDALQAIYDRHHMNGDGSAGKVSGDSLRALGIDPDAAGR
jgi:DnaJ-class molecular chaperone